MTWKLRNDFKEFSNSSCHFLDSRLVPQQAIALMHELTLLIVTSMKKLYEKKHVELVLLQALKFCARSSELYF